MLLIFLKAPIPGLVKTRLASEFGDTGACDIYKKFTEGVLNSAQKSGQTLRLYFYPAHGKESVTAWLGNQYQLVLQEGADLGERMKNAFSSTFEGGHEKTVLIGTDIPDLDEKTINKAFNVLDRHDCVLGPAEDGGYYLIGFTKCGFNRKVFNDVKWGTNSVLNETVSVLDAEHVSYSLLESKNDIDTPEDYLNYLKSR